MTKEDRDKELSDINQKRIALGELAGQLGSFIGGGEKVTEAINKAINILTEQQNKCKNCENNLHNSGDCQDPSNCQSVQQKIDELKKQETAIKSNKNNPHDLLNNLCTGLENLLGFNSDSKGYDGSGIVYSDLDRLCDAVMGFLYGVLGAVKNENEVTTYDQYIENENKRLNKVLGKLQSSIGSGRTGLAVSVDAVKAWLEGYETQITNKTKAVTDNITHLMNDIQRHKNKIEDEKLSDLSTQIANWTARAEQYRLHVEQADKDMKHLDSNLLGTLTRNIQMLFQATGTFKEAAKVEDMKEMYDLTNKRLTKVTNQVEKVSQAYAARIQWFLEKRIGDLMRSLQNLQNTQFRALLTSVNEHLKDASNNFVSAINDLEKNYNTKLIGELKLIMEDAKALKENVIEEKRKLNGHVRDLGERIKNLTGISQKVIPPKQLNKYQSDTEGDDKWNLRSEIDAVTDEIDKNVKAHVATILNDIQGQVKGIKKHLGDKKEQPVIEANPDDDTLYHNWEALKGEVTGCVESLTSEVGGNTSLTQIKKGIIDFTKGFGTTTLSDAISDMVDKIVESGAVTGYVNGYVGSNTKLKGTGQRENVKKAIKTVLPEYMQSEILLRATESGLSSTKNLTGIAGKFRHFSEQVVKDIGSKFDVTMVVQLVEVQLMTMGTLQDTLGLTRGPLPLQHQPITNTSNLKSALNTTITAVVTAISKTAAQLQKLIEMSNIDPNLEKSIENITEIGKSFKSGTIDKKSPGEKIDTGMKGVHDQINTLNDKLQNAIKRAKNEDITDDHAELAKKVEDIKAQATKDEFEAELAKLLQNTANVSLKKMQEAVNRIVRIPSKTVTSTLEGIQNGLNALQTQSGLNVTTDVPEGNSELEKKSYDLHKRIQDFLKIKVGEDGKETESVYKSLVSLRIRVGELSAKVEGVRSNVTAVGVEIDNCINEASVILKDAPAKVKSIIDELHDDIAGKVCVAFNEIQDKAKDVYAARKTQEVSALQSIINQQLSHIKKTIQLDKITGLKGLLTRLSHNVVNNVTHIKYVQPTSQTGAAATSITDPPKKCPLVQAVKYLITGVNAFSDSILSQDEILRVVNRVTPVTDSLKGLLKRIEKSEHHDHKVVRKRSEFEEVLEKFKPETMDDARKKVLTPLKKGFGKFVYELGKQYVNKYSGQIYAGLLVKPKVSSDSKAVTTPAQKPVDETEITQYGRKCAKVCLTTFTILFNNLTEVKRNCDGEGKFKKIYLSTEQTKNRVGDYLALCGYTVSNRDEQNGELQRNDKMKGNDILHNLCRTSSSVFNSKKEEDFSGQLQDIFDYLQHYYRVCHLPTTTSNKYPSSVFHMLRWLCGFSHNRVYHELSVNDFSDLFEKQNDAEPTKGDDLPVLTVTDGGDNSVIPVVGESADSLIAYPANVTASNLRTTLTEVCHIAHDVLVAIIGHGHADGIYAVDFNTNPDGFSYPTAPGACFDMLCDVLNRLYQQLFFLYGQCSNEEPSVSWRDCWYGNQVGGSDWKCNAMQCPNQKGNQIHKQKCNQTCDQTAQCGIKSPLQSFLEDGLPGFLPHSFTKPGCKLTCTLSNHRGIPCRTPMGFADISVTASHRQTGAYLKKVLEDFCGSESAPLTKLCAQLTCILQKPPQTLGDIFAFYYGYLGEWVGDFYRRPKQKQPYTQAAFMQAVNDAYFGEQYGHLDPTSLVSSSKHGEEHTNGNLCSIANCQSASVAPCGLYVKSMTQEISKYYSAEHKGNHLSWVVYITETFCDLLKKLYDDCCKKCGPAGSKCHFKSCEEKCEIKYSDDKKTSVEDKSHKHDCKSIINCRDTHPTLYKYGFTFGNTWAHNGSRNEQRAKRTCKDFCEALKKMLAEGSVLITLRGQIDDFLWAIRTPFSYLVLALWSLSLFYLLCVMVGRLDVLHIRSHLRSPSSHRITAQSLLAAAQVGRLAKISYLQP